MMGLVWFIFERVRPDSRLITDSSQFSCGSLSTHPRTIAALPIEWCVNA